LETEFFGAFDEASSFDGAGGSSAHGGAGSGRDLGERLRSATRVERFRGTPDTPNVFRQASGPGWALVGDAGLVMDPITGQGIGNAFRDAEALSIAILEGWTEPGVLYAKLALFAQKRDVSRLPMYDMTTDLTAFRASRRSAIMFAAIEQNEQATERFLGVLTGAISPKEFFAPNALRKLLGVRTVLRLLDAGTHDTLRKYLHNRASRGTTIGTHLNG
jgi:2-polyprenyl-6-methoxyphenol hydroxylase-like FAD-dependent oxidoreductase